MKITALTTDQDLYNQINESRENYDISDLLDIKHQIENNMEEERFPLTLRAIEEIIYSL